MGVGRGDEVSLLSIAFFFSALLFTTAAAAGIDALFARITCLQFWGNSLMRLFVSAGGGTPGCGGGGGA